MEEEIIKYEIQPKKRANRKKETKQKDIDVKIQELNSKILRLEQLEKEKQDRLEQKKLLKEEKQKQKGLDKIEKQKQLEEKEKQKQEQLDNKIKQMIEDSKRAVLKNKIQEIDTHKIDLQNFHIQKHNQIRRLNLNF